MIAYYCRSRGLASKENGSLSGSWLRSWNGRLLSFVVWQLGCCRCLWLSCSTPPRHLAKWQDCFLWAALSTDWCRNPWASQGVREGTLRGDWSNPGSWTLRYVCSARKENLPDFLCHYTVLDLRSMVQRWCYFPQFNPHCSLQQKFWSCAGYVCRCFGVVFGRGWPQSGGFRAYPSLHRTLFANASKSTPQN